MSGIHFSRPFVWVLMLGATKPPGASLALPRFRNLEQGQQRQTPRTGWTPQLNLRQDRPIRYQVLGIWCSDPLCNRSPFALVTLALLRPPSAFRWIARPCARPGPAIWKGGSPSHDGAVWVSWQACHFGPCGPAVTAFNSPRALNAKPGGSPSPRLPRQSRTW